MERKCCCFGHRNLFYEVTDKLNLTIVKLIEEHNVTIFISGGMGDFDALFEKAVCKAKLKYPQIQLILVKPYFSNKLNTNKDFYEQIYDSIIIPEELANVHYKAAIKKRNKLIVDNCDFIISCIYRNFGGAYDAVKYAESKNKTIISLL